MKKVFEEAKHLLQSNGRFAIATVVETRGSTPQKPGAKLLVKEDGQGIGTLGGGCVEGDIWFAAKEMLFDKAPPQKKDYLLNEDIAAREGLVCGGTMTFYIEQISNNDSFGTFVNDIVSAYNGSEPVALATITNAKGSREFIGSKMLIRNDKSTTGTLGTNALDLHALHLAEEVMSMGRNLHIATDTGEEMFIEGYTSPPTIVLMGGGHIAKSIASLAEHLQYRLFVMDDRAEFSNKNRFPYATDTIVSSYDTGLESFPIAENTAIIIATRGHYFDDIALESALKTKAKYIGLVGSKRKTILIYKELLKKKISPETLKKVYAPVGLDIGAISPEEIAVSIMAQVVQFYMGGSGKALTMEEKRIEKFATTGTT